jgi:hypothetical protein
LKAEYGWPVFGACSGRARYFTLFFLVYVEPKLFLLSREKILKCSPYLCTKGVLIPGHVAHTFIRPASPLISLVSASPTSTFNPVASIVSAVNLHWDCPPSLLQDLAASHSDWEVWLQSYFEEKSGIASLGTFKCLTLGEYCALWEKGAPKAIPTMCVLIIKKDKQIMPLNAKSQTVFLGNHESRDWSKSNQFAPVLRVDSLHFLVSLAVQHHHGLKQGNCKNTFCQGILHPDEVTIVHTPSSDPDAAKDKYWLLQKTLYSLRRRSSHWYNKINSILRSIGLVPNTHDPCFYTGLVPDPHDPSASQSSVPLSVGLYANNFVYFYKDPVGETLFEHLLQERVKFDLWDWLNGFLAFIFLDVLLLCRLMSI